MQNLMKIWANWSDTWNMLEFCVLFTLILKWIKFNLNDKFRIIDVIRFTVLGELNQNKFEKS
jgi:hypothetical protein